MFQIGREDATGADHSGGLGVRLLAIEPVVRLTGHDAVHGAVRHRNVLG